MGLGALGVVGIGGMQSA
ncbi:hypothetical protein JNB85_07685 [Rhizobium mesosinicum]|uniref:Uncharacterized protein n=1 Tax=Rhizobium mesosinicum TaxID=335017 RepID=A0ABS7GQS1_9HYPH|nr:hypothetical protein [Rhizobium mesosinicum]